MQPPGTRFQRFSAIITPQERTASPAMLHFAGAVLALAVPVWGVAALLPPVGAGIGALGSLAAFAIVAGIAFIGLRADYPHRSLGLCNVVTLARAALATVLAAPLLTPDLVPRNPQVGWTLLAVALVAFALDGIDGWLARRSGLSSRFGARFDMEVDALLALILALLALQAGKAGPWVLLLGAMRYLFIAAGWALPWLKAQLPDRFSRKVVCVIQIGVLVAMLSPVLQPPVSEGLAVTATLLLIWSFALDIVWLARHRT